MRFNLLPQRERISTLALCVSLGWLASGFSLQARAADMSIGNEGIRVNQDTTLELEFVESHGAYQSTFGVINLTTKEKTPLLVETRPADTADSIFQPSSKIDDFGTPKDFLGTPGKAVPQSKATYTFKPNNEYVTYLESSFNGRPTGILYSTDRLNPNQERQVTFQGDLNSLCKTGGMTIGWDDTGSRIVRNRPQQDRDFDDFIVKMRDAACPIGGPTEPPPVTSAVETPGTPVGQLPPGTPPAGVTPGGGFPVLPVLGGAAAIAGLAAGLSGGGDSGGGGGGGAVPPEEIPEPMTLLGSGAAVGLATLMHRRRSRNKKSQKK